MRGPRAPVPEVVVIENDPGIVGGVRQERVEHEADRIVPVAIDSEEGDAFATQGLRLGRQRIGEPAGHDATLLVGEPEALDRGPHVRNSGAAVVVVVRALDIALVSLCQGAIPLVGGRQSLEAVEHPDRLDDLAVLVALHQQHAEAATAFPGAAFDDASAEVLFNAVKGALEREEKGRLRDHGVGGDFPADPVEYFLILTTGHELLPKRILPLKLAGWPATAHRQ